MSEVTARRRATTERLLAAAREVIVERGLAAASVEEISERAGFTRGAFYSNFVSKDELIVALVQELTSRRMAAIESSAASSAESPADSIADTVLHGVTTFLSLEAGGVEEVVLVAELQLWAIRNPEFRAVYNEMVDETLRFLAATIDRFVEESGAHYTVDRVTVVRTLHALYDYHSLRGILEPGEPIAASFVEVVNQLLTDR